MTSPAISAVISPPSPSELVSRISTFVEEKDGSFLKSKMPIPSKINPTRPDNKIALFRDEVNQLSTNKNYILNFITVQPFVYLSVFFRKFYNFFLRLGQFI